MTTKRTDLDWSKHKVEILESPGVVITHLAIPDSMHHNIKYINAGGILAVTGDFGNWIFCREFHPDPENGVSSSYWDEKLTILSTQKWWDFDGEGTKKELEEMLNDEDQNWSDEEKEYINNCIEATFDESEYNAVARDYPRGWDSENCRFCKRRNFWLNAVYDGFDEVCRIMREDLTRVFVRTHTKGSHKTYTTWYMNSLKPKLNADQE